jgi:hypothetical protein
VDKKVLAVPHRHVVRTTGDLVERCRSGRRQAADAASHARFDERGAMLPGVAAGDAAHGVALNRRLGIFILGLTGTDFETALAQQNA